MSMWLKSGRRLILLLAALWAVPARAAWELNMPRGVTPYAHRVYELHMGVLWACVAIGVVVFGIMIWSIIFHRKSRNPEPSKFTHNSRIEAIWTTIPFIILFLMAVPATQTLMAMEDTTGYEMTVKITGYQWLWEYQYVGEGVTFVSRLSRESNRARRLGSDIAPASVEHYLLDVNKPLVLPIKTKVRFLITSGDVIHSWWVPALGWKRDAIPGYINTAWTYILEEGTYRGQCAELCGRDHAFMPIVIKAVSQSEYQAWLEKKKRAAGVLPDKKPSARTGDQVAAAQPAENKAGAQKQAKAQAGDTAVSATATPDPAKGAAGERTAGAKTGNKTGKMSMDELMALGKQVYTANCVACHQADGEGMPPAFPSLVDSPVVAGPVEKHLKTVIHGVSGTAMQAFGELGILNPKEIAAVVTYERNAWGQDSGDMVQPSQVKALMGATK